MATAPVLFRRVDADTFVSYDPLADAYEVVPAHLVPPLDVVAEPAPRVRLSHGAPGDRGEFRRALLEAMLEFQERAHAAGEPEAADPYLKSLAHLASDPDAHRTLRMSWVSTPTARGKYGVKAVGEGEHAGRVLYGQAAVKALHRGPGGSEKELKQQRSESRARDILTAAHADIDRISHEDLNELATHLPALSIERLRNARVLLGATWGAKSPRRQQMVDALVNHIRAHVDRQMAAAGMVPEEPKAEPSAPEPTAQPAPAAQPDAPADFTKWDKLLRTSKDRAQAEQIARATGTPIRPEAPAAPAPDAGGLGDRFTAAQGDPSRTQKLLGDMNAPEVRRDDLVALAEQVSPELHGKAKKLPKAKLIDLFREHLAGAAAPVAPSAPPPAAPAPAARPRGADDAAPTADEFEAASEPARPAARPVPPAPGPDLPEPEPGNLFHTGGEKPRTDQVRAAQDLAVAAQRRMPGLHIPPVPADAPLSDHLHALTAIDRHLRELGVRSTFFGDAADRLDEVLADHKGGGHDRDKMLELADDARRGQLIDTHSADDIAADLRGAGHEDAARFFERQARKVEEHILRTALEAAAGPEPDGARGAATVEEIEQRMRDAFGPNSGDHANSAEAFEHALDGADPDARKAFYAKHGLTPENPNKKHYETRRQNAHKAAGRLGPKGEGEPAPAAIDNGNKNDRISGEGAPASQPKVTDDRRELEAASQGAGEGGLRHGGVGGAAPHEPDALPAGTGEGAGGRPAALPEGAGGRGAAAPGPADRPGDAAGPGAGTGARRPARDKRRLTRPDGAGPPRADDGTRLGGGLDGAQPALPDPAPHEQVVSEPPAPDNPTDVSAGNFRYADREFFKGGAKTKFNANLAAIRTLREIQAEGRTSATPEEQAILSKFTGWGQFPAAFNDFDRTGDWTKERQALQSLLSPDEYEAAKRSTLNAHYTHPDVVDAHWKIAQKLGFAGGRYLETSAGIGYYLGLMPPELGAKTRTSAVELDPTTGGMLKLLYPAANVNVQGFQDHLSPDNHYDLVASNVPFGAYKVHDPKYNKHQANIHDYFFLKSADKVRPGGLVMHITSAGTLDKSDPKVRQALHDAGLDLVSAVRFPGAAHKENAGTDVVTDMVILRKRLPGEQPGDTSWLETTTVPDPAGGEPIPVNRYFAQNPHMVLGTIDRTGSMYRGDATNVSRTADYDARLQKAIDALPANVMSSGRAPAQRFAPEVLPAPGDVKEGGFHVKDGKVFVKEGGASTEQKLAPAAVKKVEAHLSVRDAFRALIKKETAGADATAERAALNAAYDAFVKKHGPLNAPANRKVFGDDPDSPPLLALEKYDPKAKTAAKADIFTKTTVTPVTRVDKVSTVAEGVGVSLHETGALDVNHVAKLLGKPADHVGRELVAQGLAYEDPSDGWQPADHYLSGNVRRKLALARAAAAGDPKYAPNVAALEQVQPEDIHHDDIDVKLGAPWVPASDVKAFAAHLLNAHPGAFDIHYIPATGEWKTGYGGHWTAARLKTSHTAESVWGASGVNFIKLLDGALNVSPVTVYRDVGDGKREIDRDATAAANQKMQEIKDEFKNWVWGDDQRRERLHRHYNDNFNNVRNIKYDGSHQTFPGANPEIQLRPHQKNAVWQVVTTGKGLLGHEVGTGKTYTMVAGAMELRRLGLARKPAIVCKKANVDAVTADALKMYPGAKILSTADMFDAANRKKAVSRIATGDYDMVILTHDHMDLLGMRPETQRKYIQGELDELEEAYQAAWDESGGDKGNRVVKELAKAKENLQAKLQDSLAAEKKDDAIHFEDTGIDHVFVDEAHRYKSLPIYTRMRGLKGVPTSRSDRAASMLMRCRWLQEQNGGRGVVFATGTPIANTVAELYNMQRYLQPQELAERGVKTFDAWANTFGDVETRMEKTATGDYKPVSRFSKFVNLPELMQLSRQAIDVQRADDLKKPDGTPVIQRPKRKDQAHVAPKSEQVTKLMNDLKSRAANLKASFSGAGKGDDNMLAICTDGRKGSIDMRMVYRDAPDDPDSKTNQMVRNALDLHHKNPGKTQMIFSDIGANPQQNGFHLFGDVIDKLVAGGIPRDQIADFTKLDGAKKEQAVEGLRAGTIRVALGGTETLGTGVNAQHKLLALHHLDCPWRPADLEQRDGRGWRHGNENAEVQIHRYVTEGSLDELFWQGIARKSKFIKQVMTPGEKLARVAKEEDTEELSPEAIMAAASGDPRILEKVQVDEDVKALANAKVRHEREQRAFASQLKGADAKAGDHQRKIADYRAAVAHLAARPDFELRAGYQTHTERPAAAGALDEAVAAAGNYNSTVGHYRGLRVVKDGGRVYLETPGGQRVFTSGTLASIEARARGMSGEAEAEETALAQHERDVAAIRDKHGKPFAKAADLEAKQKRQKELEEALAGPKEGATAASGAT